MDKRIRFKFVCSCVYNISDRIINYDDQNIYLYHKIPLISIKSALIFSYQDDQTIYWSSLPYFHQNLHSRVGKYYHSLRSAAKLGESDIVSITQYYLFGRIIDRIRNSITGINNI